MVMARRKYDFKPDNFRATLASKLYLTPKQRMTILRWFLFVVLLVVTSVLQDVDMAVINGNYAIDAGLKIADALAAEAEDGIAAEAYVNVVTVMEGKENDAKIQALVKALTSPEAKAFMEETYAGAVVPLF